jgi:ATP-dependent DNA ligase
MFRRIVTNGGEGIIIKKTNAPYTPWKKPAGVWIKCKKKITFEAVIMGYKAGTGKNASMFGSIEFGLYDGGQLRKMGFTSSGLNDATRAIIAANPDSFINTVMEIEAIQASRTSFRNAVFLRLRDDKGASECTLESIKPKEEIL